MAMTASLASPKGLLNHLKGKAAVMQTMVEITQLPQTHGYS
jgi:hypothetical protein